MTKIGNSYYIRVPKALIDCNILDPKKEIIIKVITPEELETENPQHCSPVVLQSQILIITNKKLKPED